MDKVCQILNTIKGLSPKELARISDALIKMLGRTDGVYGVAVQEVEKCRCCGAEQFVKFGKDKNGKQRYKCKSCGATFISTSNSMISRTRHSDYIWETYVELLLKGAPLTECAYRCGISVRTAFIWRHKILSTLQNDQNNRIMAGIIEADEMFIPISYKGNHTKSKYFVMPRKPYKRGTDNRSNKSPKACVMCAIERMGQSYGEVIGVGQPTVKMISHAFDSRIAPGSIMLSDSALAMKSFFEKKDNIDLIRLKSSVTGRQGRHDGGKPEVRGIYHIQTVNNFHNRLHTFMRRYLGVSTKYLNHYINLFVWIENHKTCQTTLAESMKCYIGNTASYVPAHALFELSALPVVS